MASRLLLKEIHAGLKCLICTGYLIDATTITECLHTFCKSCLLIYFEKKNHSCPVCGFPLNVKNPQLRSDKTLQDIVYKVVPDLYRNEMSARTNFYADSDDTDFSNQSDSDVSDFTSNDEKDDGISSLSSSSSWSYTGFSTRSFKKASYRNRKQRERKQVLAEIPERTIISSNDSISLDLMFRDEISSRIPEQHIYLCCPAMLRVEHLKKFCFNKFALSHDAFEIDVYYEKLPLLDNYTLMDIAYISQWKQTAPLKLYFTLCEKQIIEGLRTRSGFKVRRVETKRKRRPYRKSNIAKNNKKSEPKTESEPKLEPEPEPEDIEKKTQFLSSFNLISKKKS